MEFWLITTPLPYRRSMRHRLKRGPLSAMWTYVAWALAYLSVATRGAPSSNGATSLSQSGRRGIYSVRASLLELSGDNNSLLD